MKHAPFTLEPVDGLINIAGGHTPHTHIHDPESSYCRYYIVPIVGCSVYILWANLVAWVPANDNTNIQVHWTQLAASIGASPARLRRITQRMATFHLAYTLPAEPSTLHLRRRAATLSPKLLEQLATNAPALAAAHDHLLHTAA